MEGGRMILEWGPRYEVGNDAVDFQHRYFIDLIKRIERDLVNSADEEYKYRLIDELRKYAEFHFTSEENVALSLSLTGISNHHELHQELIAQFEQKSSRLKTGEMTYKEFIQFLIEWFPIGKSRGMAKQPP